MDLRELAAAPRPAPADQAKADGDEAGDCRFQTNPDTYV
jgi:hypothetical protein